MLDFPKTVEEIPLDYPVLDTGDYRGVIANLAGALAWVGLNLRVPSLAIVWVALCAVGGVSMFAAPGVSPFWSLAFVALLFAYPLALRLKLDAFAERWRDYLHKYMGGRVYRGLLIEFSDRARDHEGVHVWQRARHWYHALAVTLDPRGFVPGVPGVPYRAHCEAQAYGYEVARGHRDLDTVAARMAQWFYFTGLELDEAESLISAYADRWRSIIRNER